METAGKRSSTCSQAFREPPGGARRQPALWNSPRSFAAEGAGGLLWVGGDGASPLQDDKAQRAAGRQDLLNESGTAEDQAFVSLWDEGFFCLTGKEAPEAENAPWGGHLYGQRML